MGNPSKSPATTTAQRLSALAELYEQGETSELIDRTVDKLLAYEADISRQQLSEIQRALAEFERQYATQSEDFYRRFQSGQTDDRTDFVEWAALVQMAATLERRLRLLTGEGEA